ncbi:hypothetical protein GCM10011609_87850 [Lentzea pudingi]|uniref:Uncharacterized protein n=1 Tax=Lentzea pudingi TaxID=1789439 RepID=A0ABQ2IV25_9PSEU|nr:hypothetical protein [Lentzea pudingi]GGN30225.1 hypothetical protein GCM10011609_87850 [Lentzea pudingi]
MLKPLKFGISFLVYAVSLGWVLGRMHGERPRRWVMGVGTVLAVSSFIELMLITVQAARGQESHFSARATQFDSWVGRGMAMIVVVLWATSLVIAIVALRSRFGDRALAAAVRWGLLLTVFGAALGALMIIPTEQQQSAVADGVSTLLGAHSVGATHGGPGLPLTGWSTEGGDLRIPHFIGIHALQALLLLGVALNSMRLRLPEDAVVRLVRVGGGYLGLVLIALTQALRAQPLLAPDLWILTSVAALIGGVAAGVVQIFRAARKTRHQPVPLPPPERNRWCSPPYSCRPGQPPTQQASRPVARRRVGIRAASGECMSLSGRWWTSSTPPSAPGAGPPPHR